MMMFGRKPRKAAPDPNVNLHTIFASGGHDIDDSRGGHALNPDIISVCSSITGTLPYDGGRSTRRLNDYDNPGALPEDIIIAGRKTSRTTTAIEEVDSSKSGTTSAGQQQGEAVVFKGWGGASPAMNTNKKPVSSPGWFARKIGNTSPPESSSPKAAAEDALKELQAIGGIEIKCLDEKPGRRGSTPDKGEEALTSSGGLDQPPISQAELLQQMVEKKKKADASNRSGTSWFGGRMKSNRDFAKDEGGKMEDLLRAPDLGTSSQHSVSDRRTSTRRKSTSWFGASTATEGSPVIPSAVRDIVLDTSSIENVVTRFDSMGDLRTVEEDEPPPAPPPPPPPPPASKLMDTSKIEIIKPVTRRSPVSATRKAVSTVGLGYRATQDQSDDDARRTPVPPQQAPSSAVSSQRKSPAPGTPLSTISAKSTVTSPSPSVTSRRQSLTGTMTNRKPAASRFDLSSSPKPLGARADALRERIANRATRRGSGSSDHGGSESGTRSRRMSIISSKPGAAAFSKTLSPDNSGGEKESHGTAPCTEDENSNPKSSNSSNAGSGVPSGTFLGGWGFMKNLGKEQVADKAAKTKKFKKSSFTPNAVDWTEVPRRKRTQISSLKKTALISEDARCQERFRWGRDLLGEAFEPYRHMLCGSDDLLPDKDQFRAFEADVEEADQGREAYVRTLMLQNGELSEREVAAFFEGLALFKVKNRALASQLMCVDAVRRFEAEQPEGMADSEWESSIEEPNNRALLRVRKHMPVNIRSLTENQILLQPSPTGKTLPKRFAKKFKNCNILQLIRMSPDDVANLHPASLENLRTHGLTLTERRALHAHLKPIGPVWKELNEREKDPLSERKYNWFVMMKQQFKEHLDEYTKHVEEYGPPGDHPYATRSDPKKGCPLIGKQCPLKADKLLDYSFDYGYPSANVYERVTNPTESDDGSVSDPKKDEAREKRAAERSEVLNRHYQGKTLKAALAVCACQEMDDAIDRLAKRQARWVKNHVIAEHYELLEDWREIQACEAALKDIRQFVCKMAERAGLELTFQNEINAKESLDTRSVLEIGLSEEVCEYSGAFLESMETRFKMLGDGVGGLKVQLKAVRALLKEIQDRNAGSLRNLGSRRPKRTVRLKSRGELESMVRKRMRNALQDGNGADTIPSLQESSSSFSAHKGSQEGDSPLSRNKKLNMLAEFTNKMEVESIVSGMTPVREEPDPTVFATPRSQEESPPVSQRSSLAPTKESPAVVGRKTDSPVVKPADRESTVPRVSPSVSARSTPAGSARSSPIVTPRLSPIPNKQAAATIAPRTSPNQNTSTAVTSSPKVTPIQDKKTTDVTSSSPRNSLNQKKQQTPGNSPGTAGTTQSKPAATRLAGSDSDALKARVAALAANRTARSENAGAAGSTAASRNSAARRETIAEIQARIAKRREARTAAAAGNDQ